MAESNHRAPLELGETLKKFKYEDTTPVIGTEFPDLNIVDDVLNAKNADEVLRDLAITISRRGVVFFRSQDNLTDDLQKVLVDRLGQVTGKPKESSLHVFPLAPAHVPDGASADREISYVNSVGFKYMFEKMPNMDKKHFDAGEWHSDIQFETVPADFTSLRVIKLPTTGGDTLWASGYEIYNRLSKTYQDFVDGMTVTCRADCVKMAIERRGETIVEKDRGHPLNHGKTLAAVHPVVRTHPVTGWRTIFALGQFSKRINELNMLESDELLKKFYSMIQENHDLQVRFKWRNSNDFAIWDNRCTFHRATFDYMDLGDRSGNRTVGIGEIPYFDPLSTSQVDAVNLIKNKGKVATNGVNGNGVHANGHTNGHTNGAHANGGHANGMHGHGAHAHGVHAH